MLLTMMATISKAAWKHGYRSGLEIKIAEQLKEAGKEVIYEREKIHYVWPERQSKYTPDFKIITASGRYFYVETKGRWLTKDRQMHLHLKTQHPDIEIRFVFSNMNAKLYKGSKTTYAQWCEKHGFKFANRTIPDEWLAE